VPKNGWTCEPRFFSSLSVVPPLVGYLARPAERRRRRPSSGNYDAHVALSPRRKPLKANFTQKDSSWRPSFAG
jgi:hypothetical protein